MFYTKPAYIKKVCMIFPVRTKKTVINYLARLILRTNISIEGFYKFKNYFKRLITISILPLIMYYNIKILTNNYHPIEV